MTTSRWTSIRTNFRMGRTEDNKGGGKAENCHFFGLRGVFDGVYLGHELKFFEIPCIFRG